MLGLKLKSFVFFLTLFSLSYFGYGQAKNVAISMKPFGDGVRHWYNIKNADNLVNPIENQPRYQEFEIEKIADNMILFQRNNGGWPKNYDMQAILTHEQIEKVSKSKHILETTFDNETTFPHIYYLAQVYTITKIEKYKIACIKGFEFILRSQYSNGGWPQYFPLKNNYSRYITFNDGAYIGVMNLLKKVIDNDQNLAFLDNKLKMKLILAYNKGLDCILKMQIVSQGNLTAWCQQHDEKDLKPAWARAFEPPSICNGESAAVVIFLMQIYNPDKKIIEAIRASVDWFERSKIYDTRIETVKIQPTESKYKTITTDYKIVVDKEASPIWTRYYELETHKPLFCDRDSKFRYSLAEVSIERRSGYAWYTYAPQEVLDAFPAWKQKWLK